MCLRGFSKCNRPFSRYTGHYIIEPITKHTNDTRNTLMPDMFNRPIIANRLTSHTAQMYEDVSPWQSSVCVVWDVRVSTFQATCDQFLRPYEPILLSFLLRQHSPRRMSFLAIYCFHASRVMTFQACRVCCCHHVQVPNDRYFR